MVFLPCLIVVVCYIKEVTYLEFHEFSEFLICITDLLPFSFNGIISCCFPGCVIAELFTEGVPLFDLSQLLAYRNGQFFPEQVLSKIEDRSIRELVTMLQIFTIMF